MVIKIREWKDHGVTRKNGKSNGQGMGRIGENFGKLISITLELLGCKTKHFIPF